mgnify:CR=1 FL=1
MCPKACRARDPPEGELVRRVLFDECVPRPFRVHLVDFDVKTIAEMGWTGTENGALLERAASEFDVLLTVDRNMSFQQALEHANIAVVLVNCYSNTVGELLQLVAEVCEALGSATSGCLTEVGKRSDGSDPA